MNDLMPLGQMEGLPALPDSSGSGMPAGPGGLSRRAKAAIVVRLLLNEGTELPLEDLPDELQASLTHQMGAMRLVDRETVAAVVAEFADELGAIGLSFPGSIAGALDALDGKISRHTAARLRKESGVRLFGDPWKRLGELDVDTLLPLMENESVEVSAIMLSKLSIATGAALLAKLPGPQARRIAYAVSLTSAATPEAVDRIGLSLAMQLDTTPTPAFTDGPVERVGALLNTATSITRDDVLEGLDAADKGFADAVRKAIFTFGNIPERIAPRDMPRVLRDVDGGDLLIALGGAEAAGYASARDFILENISARMADQLREDMEGQGKIKPAEAEEAMSKVVEVIRAMEQAGDLLLIAPDEDEEE